MEVKVENSDNESTKQEFTQKRAHIKIKKNNNNVFSHTRFTKNEKDILYSLFRKYQEIIDSKQRRSSNNSTKLKSMGSLKKCWETITTLYNANPYITTKREKKQIQKFWLNSKLRKKFPPSSSIAQTPTSCSKVTILPATSKRIKRREDYPSSIKCEPREIIIQTNLNHSFITQNAENSYHEKHQEYQHHDTITTNNINVIEDHQQNVIVNDEEILPNCIEQISADKLSLSDLLHFKGTIMTTTKSTNTMSSEHNHHENLPETITDEISDNIPMTTCVATNNINEVYSQSNVNLGVCEDNSGNIGNSFTQEFLTEKLNYYKLKEAELKLQEEQIRVEKLRIELEKSKEELNYMKKIHCLQIEEKKIRLNILSNNTTNNTLDRVM